MTRDHSLPTRELSREDKVTDREARMILLVEDEAIIAMSTRQDLEQYGYEVVIATSATQAVDTVNDRPDIQLVLMDMNLGGEADGSEAAGRILQNHSLPVVFLSSYSELEVVDRAKPFGTYGYVFKGSSIAVLDESIRTAFNLFVAKQERKER